MQLLDHKLYLATYVCIMDTYSTNYCVQYLNRVDIASYTDNVASRYIN